MTKAEKRYLIGKMMFYDNIYADSYNKAIEQGDSDAETYFNSKLDLICDIWDIIDKMDVKEETESNGCDLKETINLEIDFISRKKAEITPIKNDVLLSNYYDGYISALLNVLKWIETK